jgi:hypothetical protein
VNALQIAALVAFAQQVRDETCPSGEPGDADRQLAILRDRAAQVLAASPVFLVSQGRRLLRRAGPDAAPLAQRQLVEWTDVAGQAQPYASYRDAFAAVHQLHDRGVIAEVFGPVLL